MFGRWTPALPLSPASPCLLKKWFQEKVADLFFTLTLPCSRSWRGVCKLCRESRACRRCQQCTPQLSRRSGQPWKVEMKEGDAGQVKLTHFPNPHSLHLPSPSWQAHRSSSSSRRPSAQDLEPPLHRAGAPWQLSPPPPSPLQSALPFGLKKKWSTYWMQSKW